MIRFKQPVSEKPADITEARSLPPEMERAVKKPATRPKQARQAKALDLWENEGGAVDEATLPTAPARDADPA